jgi:hypothetical protein
MADFGQEVAAHVARYKKRLRATARTAVQDTIKIAQTPVAKGGKMPVKDGFLRASIGAAIGQMPSGQTSNESGKVYAEGEQVAGTPVSVVLLTWQPGDTLFIGWTAAYARRMEYGFSGEDSLGRTYSQTGFGFLRGAVELWDQTVDAAAKKVRTQGL